MPELFKYCKRAHMEAMLADGQLRVGTLFGWRDAGTHGDMSTDALEGIVRTIGNLIIWDYSHIAAMKIDSTVRVEGEGASAVRHFTNDFVRSPDVYTFCASSAYSEEQHRLWLESEGYDACYRIHSPRLYFRAVSEQLIDAEFLFFAGAEYLREGEANHEIKGRFHPALLKRAGGYDDQQEVRALWKPRSPAAIKAVVIPTSRAGKYCSAHRTL